MKKKLKRLLASSENKPARSREAAPVSRVRLKTKDAENRRPYGLSTTVEVACPFCGQIEEIPIDEGGGEHQEFVEDCSVCCRPRVVHLDQSEESTGPQVWLERAV